MFGIDESQTGERYVQPDAARVRTNTANAFETAQ
jgi:hypothetical protein